MVLLEIKLKIILIGHRVESLQGMQFRIWATQRLRDYIIKGFALNEPDLSLMNLHCRKQWTSMINIRWHKSSWSI